MGIEKREGDAPLPDSSILNPDTAPLGPEAPTTDIVDGDEVVKTAEDIAGEMNAENPEGPEYAPKGTVPEPPVEGEGEAVGTRYEGEYDDENGERKETKKGTPAGTPL
jgi:hypothetical protein